MTLGNFRGIVEELIKPKLYFSTRPCAICSIFNLNLCTFKSNLLLSGLKREDYTNRTICLLDFIIDIEIWLLNKRYHDITIKTYVHLLSESENVQAVIG